MSSVPQPQDVLPHRYPFILLDRVVSIEPGHAAVAEKLVSRTDPFVDADGVLPPVLLVEVMAQAAGLAAARAEERDVLATLAKVDRFRCRPPLMVGDRIRVRAQVVRRFGSNVIVRASLRVDDHPRAAAELVLHFAQPVRG
jgi:3-hydroxyacyl-[acyl-carrier-protein] dehydratase